MLFYLKFNPAFGQFKTVANRKNDTLVNCNCPVIKYVNPGFSYYPTLDDRIHYNTLIGYTKWKLAGGKTSFDTLFTSGNQFSNSTSGSSFWTDFTLISPRTPVKLIHPDNTFTLNMTPCKNQSGVYALEINMSFSQSILADIRDFDYSSFDYSTLAYVHAFIELLRERPDQLIMRALLYQSKSDDGLERLNRSINLMNQNYATGIPLLTKDNYRDSLVISGILDSLVSKKLKQENVLTTCIIQSMPGKHKLNDNERNNLSMCLPQKFDYQAYRLLHDENYITPSINLSFYSDRAVVQISSDIIREKFPSNESLKYDEITIKFKSASSTSSASMQFDVTGACIPLSVISGTNIGLNFTAAELLTDSTQLSRIFTTQDYAKYPQLAKTSVKGSTQKLAAGNIIRYDTLLTQFTGLRVKNAQLKLDVGKQLYEFDGVDLLINNRFIAGIVAIDIAPKNINKVVIGSKTAALKTLYINQLISAFKKSRLLSVTSEVSNRKLIIYFKKFAAKLALKGH